MDCAVMTSSDSDLGFKGFGLTSPEVSQIVVRLFNTDSRCANGFISPIRDLVFGDT